MKTFALSVALAALVAPSLALAETHSVAPGENAQEALQEALILAEPGDTIMLEAGRYTLTDGLSLDVDNVIVRGAGMNTTVLDFTGQVGAGEGLLVTSDNVTLRDFAVENTKGDGIKSKGADNVVYARVRVEWTGGPKESNGAYGVYPVESVGVLVDSVTVKGASDAGIYVGQSRNIVVRNSVVEYNVAGIEIENSRDARVTGNFVRHNTGGILVFDLPNLPNLVNDGGAGGNVLVDHNIVIANDTPNFAPAGNIVASVRMGTGMLIMANDGVELSNNVIADNATAAVMVIAYPLPFEDEVYNPYPRKVGIWASNEFLRNGFSPQLPGGDQLAAAFGGEIPAILWDGLGDRALMVPEDMTVLSLALPAQATGVEAANPVPISGEDIPFSGEKVSYADHIIARAEALERMEISAEMEARARP